MILLAAAAAIAPLHPLIGHCWRGTLPGGGIDTHCFRAGDRGAARDHHVVRMRGKAVYQGDTNYRADGPALRFVYRNAGGDVMRGVVRAVSGGLRFVPDDGPPLDWHWQGRRAYTAPAAGARVTFRRVN